MKSYGEAIKYLEELNKFGWKPGLDRISKLLGLLGNPEQSFKSIHVGGTNGKGSVTVTLAKSLKDQGYKVGQYISPELFDLRERVQVDEAWIKEEKLLEYLFLIKEKTDYMTFHNLEAPTDFEVWTAMAFLHFKEEKVDFAVVEVGLGGEIDSTNVITPVVSVITNVTIDHKDYLGDSVEGIAKVKSGIIKRGVPVVTGSEDERVIKILRAKALSLDSQIYIFNKDFWSKQIDLQVNKTIFRFINDFFEEKVEYSLTGKHQLNNGGVVLQTLGVLKEAGYEIDFPKVLESFKNILWPGRLELLEYGGKKILFDAAHNLDGAKSLSYALANIYEYEKLVLVVGILADKDREAMIDLIGPLADEVIVTRPNNDRATDFEKIVDYFRVYTSEIEIIAEIEAAFNKGLELAGSKDLLCITGSIYMLKDIRKLFVKL